MQGKKNCIIADFPIIYKTLGYTLSQTTQQPVAYKTQQELENANFTRLKG